MFWDTMSVLLSAMALLVAAVTLIVMFADRRLIVTVEPADDLAPFDWEAAERQMEDGPNVDHA